MPDPDLGNVNYANLPGFWFQGEMRCSQPEQNLPRPLQGDHNLKLVNPN